MRAPTFVRAAAFGATVTFATGAWAQAAEHLEKARAAEAANQPVRAAEEADRALVSPDLTDSQREDANHLLGNVGDQVALLVFEGDGTLSIEIDEGGEERSPARHRLEPGSHDVVYRNLETGATFAEKIVIPAGDAHIVHGPTPPKPPGADFPKHSKPYYESRWHVPMGTWISYGITAVGTGLAIGFAIPGFKSCTTAVDPSGVTNDCSARDRDHTIALVAGGAAIVGAVAGTVILLVAGKERVEVYPDITLGDWRIGF
ncbi:MAG TPA: hypothetical protein VF407_07055 [Polyangiaceae bacterium]